MSNLKKTSNKHLNRQTVATIIADCQVAPAQLKKYSDSNSLPKTTADAPMLDLSFGQDRAVQALQTACAIKATGYHVFAAGENGLGKRTFIQHYLNQHGVLQAPVTDWIYVYNFQNPRQPLAIGLEVGSGKQLFAQIHDIWQQTYAHLLSVATELISTSTTQSGNVLTDNVLTGNALSPSAQQQLLQHAQDYLAPLFTNLSASFSTSSATASASTNRKLATYLQQLQADMAHEVLRSVLADCLHLNRTPSDKVTLDELSTAPTPQLSKKPSKRLPKQPFKQLPKKYCFQPLLEQPHPNVAVSQLGAPIVFLANPSLANLFGRIHDDPYRNTNLNSNQIHSYHGYCNDSIDGAYDLSHPYLDSSTTDCAPRDIRPALQHPYYQQPLIEPGALHQANGGYLLIEAHQLNDYPDAWRALKLALTTKRIDFDFAQQQCANSVQLNSPVITPEPIPLSVKVILLGDPDLYDQLTDQDADFSILFKIRADFHQEVERTVANERQMIAKFADIIDKYQLHHFDASAQAVVLEYLSLQSEDQNKLSLHADSLIQLMLEASRHADLSEQAIHAKTSTQPKPTLAQDKAKLVSAIHVKRALSDIAYRAGYLKELYLQEITDGQQLISTSGTAVGQINALTIIDYANSEFGMPALLTAVVQNSVGSGDILDIERDVELGGSLHAKGMLIMNSYLRALFSPYYPLNFTASLAFEQSYAHIDGDSATLAEACALLSALAEVPISQGLGITGSMNQLGKVQAVGGVNTKVTGFFDACSHQGLTGDQGVILPFANISQLMLRDDIIAAVEAGQFHIYGVKTLSEALTILANKTVDSKNKKGRYRHSSLFGKIIKNLQKWEEQLNPPEEVESSELPEANTDNSCDVSPKPTNKSSKKSKADSRSDTTT